MKIRLLGMLVLVAGLSVPALADIDFYFLETDLRVAAEEGDKIAQWILADRYYLQGQNDPQNYVESVRLYRLAAEQGNANAQHSLGGMYEDGKGVPQNVAEAVRLYRLAAEQEYPFAQYDLARMYEEGKGVPQNFAEAMRLYQLATTIIHANVRIGSMYNKGLGVPEDKAEAVRWWRRAAEKGNATGQGLLGMFYYFGSGVPKNNLHAYKWLSLAKARGESGLDPFFLLLEREMTPEQIAEAQRLATEAWEQIWGRN